MRTLPDAATAALDELDDDDVLGPPDPPELLLLFNGRNRWTNGKRRSAVADTPFDDQRIEGPWLLPRECCCE